MNATRILPKLAGLVVLAFAGMASAHDMPNAGYMTDINGNIVKNNYGECWRTGYWTPAMAVEECDPGLVPKKEAPRKAEAKLAPAPVMAAPVEAAPAPVVRAAEPPAPPRETWKTTLIDKPVRLEGASFASGSAKLLRSADKKLDEVVAAAKQYPDVKLEVSGYTDSSGNKAANQRLSESRAAAVKQYLVKKGVATDRIVAAGYADARPVADNKTKEGRAANRRVEVHYILKEEKKVRVVE